MRPVLFIAFFFFTQNIAAQADTALITRAQLSHWVHALSHDSMMGRLAGHPGGERAAQYLAQQFDSLQLAPLQDSGSYFQPFAFEGAHGPSTGNNILGAIRGRVDTAIVFSAHYDHLGTAGKNISQAVQRMLRHDTVYNGANDNASGVAALLALASYFRQMETPHYTLLFIAFDAEEHGLLGSKHMAEQPLPAPIKYVFNFEMLGRKNRSRKTQPYLFAAPGQMTRKGMLGMLNKNLGLHRYRDYFFRAYPYRENDLFSRSDNYPFHEIGITAVSFMMTDDDDENYHVADDEANAIDYPMLEEVVRKLAVALTPFVMNDTK